MAPSFWGGFNEPDRDFPSANAAHLFRESINESPTYDHMRSDERDDIRERFIDDIATGDVSDLRDWLGDLDIDWSRQDLLDWIEDVDTDRWTMDDWDAWRSMYG